MSLPLLLRALFAQLPSGFENFAEIQRRFHVHNLLHHVVSHLKHVLLSSPRGFTFEKRVTFFAKWIYFLPIQNDQDTKRDPVVADDETRVEYRILEELNHAFSGSEISVA